MNPNDGELLPGDDDELAALLQPEVDDSDLAALLQPEGEQPGVFAEAQQGVLAESHHGVLAEPQQGVLAEAQHGVLAEPQQGVLAEPQQGGVAALAPQRNTGRWTEQEIIQVNLALADNLYGQWARISREYVPTRDSRQVRQHLVHRMNIGEIEVGQNANPQPLPHHPPELPNNPDQGLLHEIQQPLPVLPPPDIIHPQPHLEQLEDMHEPPNNPELVYPGQGLLEEVQQPLPAPQLPEDYLQQLEDMENPPHNPALVYLGQELLHEIQQQLPALPPPDIIHPQPHLPPEH